MGRFLKKAFLLSALVLGTVACVFLLPLPIFSGENLSIILNKRNLLKDGRTNRVILVGGSGLFVGFDSRMAEERLRRPVSNMGLYAGFAITPLLHGIRPYLRPGDTVVIVPEYNVVLDSPDSRALKWALALAPVRNFPLLYDAARSRGREVVFDVLSLVSAKLKPLPRVARDALRSWSLPWFAGSGHIEYGKHVDRYGDALDMIRPSEPERLEGRGDNAFGSAARDQSFEGINAFSREAGRLGVRFFFFFPAYPIDEYRRQEKAMRRYEDRLRRELACPVLGTPQDFLYPYEYFTDSVNHINSEAKHMRTEKLLGLLEQAIGNGP